MWNTTKSVYDPSNNTTIMNDYLNNLLLGYFPYMALAVFAAGVIYHLWISNKTVQATSSQFLRGGKGMFWGSTLFHYAILLVVLGHIFGLLTPEWLYTLVMTNETKRLLAIIMGSLSGGVALVGIVYLLFRRIGDARIRAISSFQDYFIPILLIVQIILGLTCTYITARSPIENYLSVDYWAQGIAWFEPDAWKYIADINILYVLHIVNGFLIFILFPYTKLMHMLMIPVRYLFKPNK